MVSISHSICFELSFYDVLHSAKLFSTGEIALYVNYCHFYSLHVPYNLNLKEEQG